MKFLNKEEEQNWFNGSQGDIRGSSRRARKRNKDEYEKIAIHQLVNETYKSWTVQLSKFDNKCQTWPKSQSHLSLSLDGGNNAIYVTKWLINHRKVNGETAITDRERERRERDQGRMNRLRTDLNRNLFNTEPEDTIAF